MATTGGVRLRRLLESGKVNQPYLWIDSYNQIVAQGITGTITTRVDAGACWFISTPPELKRI